MDENELRELFKATNTSEPLSEGWPGLLRFGLAVAAATREACAKACDDAAQELRREGEGCTNAQYDWMADGAERCADELRSNANVTGLAPKEDITK